MIIRILLLMYVFISIGVYIKLLKLGASKMNIIYAPVLPIFSFYTCNKLLFKYLNNDKSINLISKIKLFLLIDIKICIYNHIYTGYMCHIFAKNSSIKIKEDVLSYISANIFAEVNKLKA